MNKLKCLTLAALLLVALPAVSQAAVPAPSGVRAAMLRDTGTSHQPSQCFTVRLAHAGSGWGIIYSDGSASGPCEEVQSGDYAIVRISHGRWVQASGGDELSHARCPIRSDPGQPVIPSAILLQLTGRHCSQKPVVLEPAYESAQVGMGMEQHPGTMVYTGDGTGALERMHWRHWGAKTATTTGVDAIKTCIPDCVGGTTTYYPIQVVAYGLGYVNATDTYSRIRVTYTRSPPVFDGHRAARTHSLTIAYDFKNDNGFYINYG